MSTSTPTISAATPNPGQLNVTSVCQDQEVILVDITGTVANIADEVRKNRERLDKINEKVEKITLPSIDRKLDSIISALSMQKQDLIEHGSRLRLIEDQLTGTYIAHLCLHP